MLARRLGEAERALLPGDVAAAAVFRVVDHELVHQRRDAAEVCLLLFGEDVRPNEAVDLQTALAVRVHAQRCSARSRTCRH